MNIEDINSYLQKQDYVSLATSDGDQPRVRTLALVKYNAKLWMVTFTGTAKLAQIERNNKIEISFDIYEEKKAGSIRGLGTARICDDMNLKKSIIPSIWFFDRYFNSIDDPNYQLIELNIHQYEVQHPVSKKMYIVEG
ncbi:MAG: pyridoxamine 5'-phosphate oxidase family protein [Candidatus Heimdallarchaeota archaeon]|nr:pyridoxamine 5'-phosphate oxidase family protein [Candidatus Heimdallarchaeota archaeon]